jgi:hypothetical protein
MQKVEQTLITASMEGLFAEELILQGAQLGRPMLQGVLGRGQAQQEGLHKSFQRKLFGLAAEKAGGFRQGKQRQNRK